MLEQIQTSPTAGDMIAEVRGKSGKQGAFANLFKALGSKGIAVGTEAKSGKPGAAAQLQPQLLSLKANTPTGVKGIRLHAEQDGDPEEQAAALKAAAGMNTAGTDAQTANPQLAAVEPAVRPLAAHAGRSASTELQDGEQATSGQRKLSNGHPDRKPSAEVLQASGKDSKVPAQTAQPGAPVEQFDDTNPRIGIARTRTAASSDMHAADRAADKGANRINPQAAGVKLAGSNDTQTAAPMDSRRPGSQAAAKTATTEFNARGVNQAGSLDSETLQMESDAVQRIRDELANMAGKEAGKTNQLTHAKVNGRDSQSPALFTVPANHAQSPHSNSATTAQAVTTQTAQAAGLTAMAAEAGQHKGGQDAAGKDSTDSRLMSAMAGESRPQQAFDLQQQAAARMTQPMRPMEAMQSIALSAAGGTTKLELQLEPAHLGKVHISLQTDAAKHLQMHLTVESAATRQVIEQHMPQLRAALEQQGLNLDNFSLHTGSQGRHEQQGFEHAAHTSARTIRGDNDDPAGNPAEGSAPDAPAFAGSRLSIHI